MSNNYDIYYDNHHRDNLGARTKTKLSVDAPGIVTKIGVKKTSMIRI